MHSTLNSPDSGPPVARASGASRASRRRPSKRGVYAVITALMLVVLCGFVALAIDLGSVRLTEAQLQAGTDSAALAGTQKLDGTSAGMTRASAAASAVASANKALGTSINVTTTGPAGSAVTLGTWNSTTKTFTASTNATLVNAVKVRSTRPSMRSWFAAVGGDLYMGAAAQSIASHVARGAGKVPYYLPFSLPSCEFATHTLGSMVNMEFTLNPAGADNTGWGAINATPSASWASSEISGMLPCMQQFFNTGTVSATCSTASVGNTVSLNNGALASSLTDLANAMPSGVTWRTSYWGALPARHTGSSVPASSYGHVLEGPIPVFAGGSHYCSASAAWNENYTVTGFVWASIYDVKATGPVAQRSVWVRLDTTHIYDIGTAFGGPNYGVVNTGSPTLVQ